MRKTIWASMFALATFAVGNEARAQQWGLHTGDTVRAGDNMPYGEFGWPNLELGFAHGLSDKVDIGAIFAFNYGFEYTTNTALGIGLRVPVRITPLRRDKISLMIHFDPGIKFDQFGSSNCDADNICTTIRPTLFGLWFPVGLELGIHIVREATISIGMEIPIYVNVTNPSFGSIPLLFGPGFEYHVDEHIALGLNTKFGPSIQAQGGGNSAEFGFITRAYFAYRL
jgi:hypothetical protein